MVVCEIDSLVPTTVASAVIAVRLSVMSSWLCWEAESLMLLVTFWNPDIVKVMV